MGRVRVKVSVKLGFAARGRESGPGCLPGTFAKSKRVTWQSQQSVAGLGAAPVLRLREES